RIRVCARKFASSFKNRFRLIAGPPRVLFIGHLVVVRLPVKRKWCVLMFRFSVPRDGIERYQDTKRYGYEAGDEDDRAFHSNINRRNLVTVPALRTRLTAWATIGSCEGTCAQICSHFRNSVLPNRLCQGPQSGILG